MRLGYGAPKQRTMQLIAELEPTLRGVYCGAIGLVAPPSAAFRARFSVAIRTAVVDRSSGAAVYGVGGGITWASDPARERAEVYAKAAVLTHDVGEHALLETFAATAEGLRNLDQHVNRMADSAAFFDFRFDRDTVLAEVRHAVQAYGGAACVRVLVARDGTVSVGFAPLPATSDRPVRLVIDPEPIDSSSPWFQHKTTRRDPYRTRAARHPEADDVVLVNELGEVTETTVANLAVRLDGRWWTPPTSSGCLPGIGRARLLAAGHLHERRLSALDLRKAEALAVVSSLRGSRPAQLIEPDGPHRGGAVHSATEALHRRPRCRPPRRTPPAA